MIIFIAILVALASLNNVNAIPPPPSGGPCVFGTFDESRAFNCTAQGYFELTQCTDKYCACVHPANGHEADGTRTFSNRILPRCGNCFTQLAKEYAKGRTDNLPVCDYDVGNYKKKQCTQNQCQCVDTITGKPYKTGGLYLECDVTTSPPEAVLINGNPIANPECVLPKDRGTRCLRTNGTNEAKVMYYFDKKTFRCLAFKHNGCGGNTNKFETISECWDACLFQDFGGCAGLKEPLLDKSTNLSVKCDSRPDNIDCPKGYKCTHLAFVSVCCEQKNEELFYRNARPKCGQNEIDPIKISDAGVTLNLLGTSCADDFCPTGSECKQMEIFAHCCPKQK